MAAGGNVTCLYLSKKLQYVELTLLHVYTESHWVFSNQSGQKSNMVFLSLRPYESACVWVLCNDAANVNRPFVILLIHLLEVLNETKFPLICSVSNFTDVSWRNHSEKRPRRQRLTAKLLVFPSSSGEAHAVVSEWALCRNNSCTSQWDGRLTLRNRRQSKTIMSISRAI